MLRAVLCFVLCASATAFTAPAARTALTQQQRAAASSMQFGFFGGGGGDKGDGRDSDLARRQDKLAARQQKAKELPKGARSGKGSVEVTFPQKGNKVVVAKQGEPIGKVVQRAGLKVKFDCKNGRCGTCQVRLNGRAAAKICQGATIPGGAVRKLKITLDN